MSLTVREMRPEDARAFLEVHHAAVRGIAAKDYAPDVIEAWAPLPLTRRLIKGVRTNRDGEYRLIAEIEGRIVGIAALVARKNELRACYVAPEASRKGVGSALMREIERAAREQGATFLEAESSLTASPFYATCGYEIRGYGEHILPNGQIMSCVKMRKELKA
jgi:putative acetyltransferase